VHQFDETVRSRDQIDDFQNAQHNGEGHDDQRNGQGDRAAGIVVQPHALKHRRDQVDDVEDQQAGQQRAQNADREHGIKADAHDHH
jgi:hypothetical protein